MVSSRLAGQCSSIVSIEGFNVIKIYIIFLGLDCNAPGSPSAWPEPGAHCGGANGTRRTCLRYILSFAERANHLPDGTSPR